MKSNDFQVPSLGGRILQLPQVVCCLNDRAVLSATLRPAIPQDLHSGYLGVNKVKSSGMMTSWWSEPNACIGIQ